jgi:phage RecT family recombinase
MTTTNTAVAARPQDAPIKLTREQRVINHLVPLLGGDERRAQKMMRVATNAMSKTPALAKVNEGKFWLAVAEIAALNLTIGQRGAYLVPYKQDVTVIISPHGLIELAFRHPLVKAVQARAVRAGDEFSVSYAPEPTVRHAPRLTGSPGDLVAAYAIVDLTTGGRIVEFMTREEILAIRQRSQSARSGGGPWVTDEGEMWRKTVLKRAMKYVPQSEEMMKGLDLDDDDTDLSVTPDHARSLVAHADADTQPVVHGEGVAGLKAMVSSVKAKTSPARGLEAVGVQEFDADEAEVVTDVQDDEQDADPWGDE